jgi:HEPN domain-containing protein
MLSLQEERDQERYKNTLLHKWYSLACVDEGTLVALTTTVSAVLRKPNSKKRKEDLKRLIKEIHDKGIYTVGHVMEEIKKIKEEYE